MVSRRTVLVGAFAAGSAVFMRRAAALFAKASQPSTRVNFDVPAGACDCHTHVFCDPRQFPFVAERTYTPESASVREMEDLHRALHIGRVVLVQPSVYGTDNACTLDAIRALGAKARGIAVVSPSTPAATLDAMHSGGIRGVRVNLETAGVADPAIARRRLRTAFDQITGRDWHVQIYARLAVVQAIADDVRQAPMPVVFDHFGGARAALGTEQPGFSDLVDLVRSGHAYVKISAAYRSSTHAPDYGDVAPLAKALIAANPQRILWGTDWPHPDTTSGRAATEISTLLQIDDGRLLNQLPVWAPDASVRKAILVDNPARLYGF